MNVIPQESERLAQEAEAAVLAGASVDALAALAEQLDAARATVRKEINARRDAAAHGDATARRERAALRAHLARLGRLGRRIRNETLETKLYDACAAKMGSMARVRMLDALILLLIFVVIAMLIVQYTCELSDATNELLDWLDTAICVVFLGEFFFKLHCAESRWWYFRRHWIDFFASIPFAGIVRLGRLARVARVARLARVVRVVRVVVFLRSRIDRSIEKNRKALDRDYELSFDVVRRYLEGLSRRRSEHEQQGAEHKLIAWLIAQVEGSLLLRMADRLTFGVVSLRSRTRTAPARGASSAPTGVGVKLAHLIGKIQAVLCCLCDFNGIVTTAQLLNYVGQALFKAGKRRGIVLFAVGAGGALFGYIVQEAFGPGLSRPKPRTIQIGAEPAGAEIKFGRVLCGRKPVAMKLYLRNSAPPPGEPVVVDTVGLVTGDVFQVRAVGSMPKSIPPGCAGAFKLTFLPPRARREAYADTLVISRQGHPPLKLAVSGWGIESAAHRFGTRARQSFGLNFVLISLPFLGIALLGWWWVRKSKQMTEDYKNVAEASYLNLMEDAKKLTMFDDLGWLYDQVFMQEAVLDYGADAVAEQERSIRRKIDAIVERERATDPSYSVEDVAYERAVFPSDSNPGVFTEDELAMTRDGFVLEAMHVISRGRPVAAIHNRKAGSAIQLYRDYLDGALFHETDRKTIEQLLGNITIRRVHKLIRYDAKDMKRLHALTAPFGSNLWLTFICRSIAEQTGRLVSEFNASCAPERDLGEDDIRGDRDLRRQYEAWLDGGPPVRGENYLTQEFNAMHFLVADAQQDERVRTLFGDRVLAKLRHERCRMIRTVFGTYPIQQTKSVNPYQLYHRIFGKNVETEIRMGRVRRALGLPKGVFTVAVLPLRMLIWIVRGLVIAFGWTKEFIRNILADVETERERPDYDAALRKITRMRGPVIAEATAIRGRFDLLYTGCRQPGEPDADAPSQCIQDLKSIGANPQTIAYYEDLRETWNQRLVELQRFLDRELSEPIPGEVMRALHTAAVIDSDGLYTLMQAEDTINAVEQAVGREDYEWPPGTRRGMLVHAIVRCFSLGRDRATQAFRDFCELTGRSMDAPTRRLFRAYRMDVDGLRGAIDAFLAHKGKPRERALELIRRIIDGGHEEWTIELITTRTVQALSLLDRRNYEVAVYQLGRFEDAGATLPKRNGCGERCTTEAGA